METYQQCEVSYRLDGRTHQGTMRIETQSVDGTTRYRAVIDDAPLRGTYGGWADDTTLAMDFLNLAMQAEGADEIVMTCTPVQRS